MRDILFSVMLTTNFLKSIFGTILDFLLMVVTYSNIFESPELNLICRILKREVYQEVKVGSLTTYSACTIPHFGHIRST